MRGHWNRTIPDWHPTYMQIKIHEQVANVIKTGLHIKYQLESPEVIQFGDGRVLISEGGSRFSEVGHYSP